MHMASFMLVLFTIMKDLLVPYFIWMLNTRLSKSAQLFSDDVWCDDVQDPEEQKREKVLSLCSVHLCNSSSSENYTTILWKEAVWLVVSHLLFNK